MSFIDSVKNIMGFGYYEEDEYEDENKEQDFYDEPVKSKKESKKSNVIRLNESSQASVIVMKLTDFDSAKAAAEYLKAKRPVVINLEGMDNDIARRVVDFLSGTIYGIDGEISRVSSGIFLVAPRNVDIVDTMNEESKFKNAFGL